MRSIDSPAVGPRSWPGSSFTSRPSVVADRSGTRAQLIRQNQLLAPRLGKQSLPRSPSSSLPEVLSRQEWTVTAGRVRVGVQTVVQKLGLEGEGQASWGQADGGPRVPWAGHPRPPAPLTRSV